MERYIQYLRVSKKSQGESGLGLESQRAIIKHFYPDCEKEFCDIKSGATANRPELQKAIKYCIENDAYLVVAKVDRLSRNVRDALEIFDQLGGKIRFCDIPGIPERFILTIHLAIGERELELISIRIRAALEAKRKRGEPMGTKISVNKDGKLMDRDRLKKANAVRKRQALEPDENSIRAYSFAYELQQSGLTLEQIAIRLNRNKFYTSVGTKWSAGTVCRMMQRMKQAEIKEDERLEALAEETKRESQLISV